ncbi:hypothetical protein TNCV_247821 [Trichonephila clavipes]|nr:hypothetical protein TNCV_247821 [Trichonephila clavipes]
MTLLGYLNRKSLKFLKFGLKMLDLECGGCFFFLQCLNEDIFLKSVPSSDTKEIQSLLAGSLLLMRSHAMLKELVSSITFTVTKNILNSILNSIDNWDDIEEAELGDIKRSSDLKYHYLMLDIYMQ